MNSQFGLANIWTQGEIVTKTVALLLLVMSVASQITIIFKTLDLIRYKKLHGAHEASGTMRTLLQPSPSETKAPLTHFVSWLLTAATPHGTTNQSRRVYMTCLTSATGSSARFTTPLTNLPPACNRVWLFWRQWAQQLRLLVCSAPSRASIWGIHYAPLAIGDAGQASIGKVAGPIDESLIMTALDLAVAIPAVLGYNALVRGNKGVLQKLNRFAHDLHAYFVTGTRVQHQHGRQN